MTDDREHFTPTTTPITIQLGFDAASGCLTVDGVPKGESLTDNLLENAIKDAYLSGYNSGFYSAGNYFPEQSWERYNANR